MKKQLITILIFVIAQALYSQTTEDAWINEIHYDNNGADSNEGIEIVVKDVSTYPLANWSIILYNGSNGETYNTFDYSVPNSTSSSNGFTIAWKEQSSIQNDVEGVALVYNSNTLVQFLSYEGSFTATNGIAIGITSTDILVFEDASGTGVSLQLSGSGNQYEVFSWQSQAASTFGTINNSQVLTNIVKEEPSSHPSNFQASIHGFNKINLTWTDAAGAIIPDGYFIKVNETGTFIDPVDLSSPINDTDFTDGEGSLFVNYGIESSSISGLQSNTTYHFKIWPYTNFGSSTDYKTDASPLETQNTTSVYVVINEILADPDEDSNGDGILSTDDDEFIEIINNTGVTQDISNWTIEDATEVRHTFNANTLLNSNESIVVFGGGTPTGINGLVQITSSLSLNNTGDDVILRNSSGEIVDQYSFGSEGNSGTSLARHPDITGSFVLHTDIISNSVSFSPGTKNSDGTPLPIELIYFTVAFQNNFVILNWESATEVNNYGFEIERTITNSKLQITNWENVGFVEGHGNSNSAKQYSYVDNSVRAGQSYSYRLKQIDFDGQFEYSSVVNVEVGVPMEFSLAQNYPNPFNPSTIIDYSVPSNEFVTIKVFDVLGNTVSTLVNENKEAGKYNVTFDASNLTSGIYFYSINAGGFTQVKKMMLVK